MEISNDFAHHRVASCFRPEDVNPENVETIDTCTELSRQIPHIQPTLVQRWAIVGRDLIKYSHIQRNHAQ